MATAKFLNDIRVKTGLVIAFLLGIPLTITFFLRTGENHYQSLPFYGPIEVKQKADTTYHQLPHFSFQSHQGDTLSLDEDLRNKNLVIHFFTAGCPGDCPEIFRKLKSLGDEYKRLDNLRIISLTTEPNIDQMKDLQQFDKEMDIRNDQWHLGRTSLKTTKRLLKEGFYFNTKTDTSSLNGINSPVTPQNGLFLVDKKNRIRGVYNGNIQQEFKKLKDEIRVLFVKQNLEYANSQ